MRQVWMLIVFSLLGSQPAQAIPSAVLDAYVAASLSKVRVCNLAAGQHTLSTVTPSSYHTGNPGADPYVYLLFEQVGGTLEYYGENDDGGPGYDSSITFTAPNSAVYPCVQLLVSSFDELSWAKKTDVLLDGQMLQEVSHGGARWARGWSGEGYYFPNPPFLRRDTIETVENDAGGTRDNWIFLINRTIGAEVERDDDGGPNLQARVRPLTGCVGGNCVIVAGRYPTWPGVTVTSHNVHVIHQSQTDFDVDADGIKAPIEAYFGSSDQNIDSDGDGLKDYWEIIAREHADGTLGDCSNGPDSCSLEVAAEGADPSQDDLFIQLDWMVANDHDDFPVESDGWSSLTDWMRKTFYEDRNFTGRTIYTHVRYGNQLPHVNHLGLKLCAPAMGNYTSLPDIKAVPGRFHPLALGVYRYVVAGHYVYDTGWGTHPCAPDTQTHGQAELSGNDAVIGVRRLIEYVNGAPDPVEAANRAQRGTVIHEIGHMLTLEHFLGNLQENDPCRAQYKSLMNYNYAHQGYVDAGGVRRFSYSLGTACGGALSCACDRNEWEKRVPPDPSANGYVQLTCNHAGFCSN